VIIRTFTTTLFFNYYLARLAGVETSAYGFAVRTLEFSNLLTLRISSAFNRSKTFATPFSPKDARPQRLGLPIQTALFPPQRRFSGHVHRLRNIRTGLNAQFRNQHHWPVPVIFSWPSDDWDSVPGPFDNLSWHLRFSLPYPRHIRSGNRPRPAWDLFPESF
jgi:hypothetical protein